MLKLVSTFPTGKRWYLFYELECCMLLVLMQQLAAAAQAPALLSLAH